jgi:GxxExxY protein
LAQMEARWTRMHADDAGLNDLSRLIIGSASTVLNTLGSGFLEKIYKNALVLELRAAGVTISQQHQMQVHYRDKLVGEFVADLLVENILLVELKTASVLTDIHRLQCINYLKAAQLPLCLLMNFGNPRLQIKRIANGL